jgi:hypothetical protein
MTSRSEPNGRAAILNSPRAPALAVVTVEDRVDEGLAGHGGCRYMAPPQPMARARDLVRLMFGRGVGPADHGPWRRAIAGGQRIVRLDPSVET